MGRPKKTISKKKVVGYYTDAKTGDLTPIEKINPKAFIAISKEKWNTDNQIPPRLRPFFINLAALMEISHPIPETHQVIEIGDLERTIVCGLSGCTDDEFYENLDIICKTDALRKVGFILYAINPAYIVYGVDE